MKLLLVCMLVATSAPITVNQVPSDFWSGTYRLDYDKSQLAGDRLSYVRRADGVWEMTLEDMHTEFAPDGKDYPMGDPSHTESVTMPAPDTLLIVTKAGERVTANIRETLSPNGMTLTDVTSYLHKDGSTTTATTLYKLETSHGGGFLGDWVSTRYTVQNAPPVTLTVTRDATGMFTLNFQGRVFVSLHADDVPQTYTGKGETGDATLALKAVSARRMDFTNRTKGKITTVGYFQLSVDGTTLDDAYWDPADPASKQTKVYVRQ